MTVTINTDASFCPDTKVGGYAFWITSNLGRIRYANRFKGNLNNSSDAEMKCILNAIYAAARKIDLHKCFVVVNTDCTAAINALSKRFPTVHFRHVRGHQKGKLDSRSFINNWCDNAAREQMRLARTGKKAKKKELEWK